MFTKSFIHRGGLNRQQLVQSRRLLWQKGNAKQDGHYHTSDIIPEYRYVNKQQHLTPEPKLALLRFTVPLMDEKSFKKTEAKQQNLQPNIIVSDMQVSINES